MTDRAEARSRRVEDVKFSDIPINFDLNPMTGQLTRIVNDEAIKRSLTNLVMVHLGEWPRHNSLGSSVHRETFGVLDNITAGVIKTAVEQAVLREPRATVRDIVVSANGDTGLSILLTFYTRNATEIQNLSLFLKRVR